LILASVNGHLKIKYLVKCGANVNEKNISVDTAFTLGTFNGHINVIKYLIKHGAKINNKDNYENTALTWGLYYKNFKIINFHNIIVLKRIKLY